MKQDISKELIEKYLAGETLPEEELAKIEEALQTNSDFVQEVGTMVSNDEPNQQLLGGIHFTGEQLLREKLSSTTDNLNQEGFFLDEEDIDAWLKNELIGEKKALFEKRLSVDRDFEKRVEERNILLEGIREYGKQRLQSKIGEAQKDLEAEGFFAEQTKKVPRVVPMRRQSRWLAIAASILLLAAVGYWIYQQGQPDADTLYADSYSIYPDKISKTYEEELKNPSRSGLIENRKPDFINAMKRYPENISVLETHINEYPEDRMASFYLALAYMNNGTFEKAEELLITLKNDPEFEDPAAVNWYLALTYLKQRKISKSNKLLKELSTGDTSDYQVKATQLLEKWNK
jgi:hypothetical protein